MATRRKSGHTLRGLYDAIREIPDFPSPGIVYRDITPVLQDPVRFRQAVRRLAAPAKELGIQKVVGIEAGGFLLGGPVSLKLKAGLVPARKRGKLPDVTHQIEYGPEYSAEAIEIHRDAIAPGERILVVDDVLATGATAAAAVEAATEAEGKVMGMSVLLELLELDGRGRLEGVPVWSVLTYPRRE
jgi:adenine phosphoribosyltransferase